ncbi:uncharacterized protein LOC129883624 [Solanum dulcamara]|uniref:uncharacterized protein LOC129883624 n=1 Tax=Solanum dulcamara TaxID=45834 RepID=UPI002486C1BB|nr:uncharacterized protein LOC129883624 [Solanum dulcamara]
MGMMVTRVCGFTRINARKFHSLKLDEDPQEFIEGIDKIIDHRTVTSREGVLGRLSTQRICTNLGEGQRAKRARTNSGDFSHAKSKNVSRQQFNQRFFDQNSSSTPSPKFDKDRVSNPKFQRGALSGQNIPSCKNCGKRHQREYLARLGACFSCGKMGHQVKNCPSSATRGGGG